LSNRAWTYLCNTLRPLSQARVHRTCRPAQGKWNKCTRMRAPVDGEVHAKPVRRQRRHLNPAVEPKNGLTSRYRMNPAAECGMHVVGTASLRGCVASLSRAARTRKLRTRADPSFWAAYKDPDIPRLSVLFQNSAATSRPRLPCQPTLHLAPLTPSVSILLISLLTSHNQVQFKPHTPYSLSVSNISPFASRISSATTSARSIRAVPQHEGLPYLPGERSYQVRRLQRRRLLKLQAGGHQKMRRL
jgi:hypothetical protein